MNITIICIFCRERAKYDCLMLNSLTDMAKELIDMRVTVKVTVLLLHFYLFVNRVNNSASHLRERMPVLRSVRSKPMYDYTDVVQTINQI